MTKREMLKRMDSQELTEWIAYSQIEPFGSFNGFYQSGTIASILANTYSKNKKFSPMDFVPECFKEKPKKKTAKDLKTVLESMAGVKIKRKK
jgi:hypothetical protein